MTKLIPTAIPFYPIYTSPKRFHDQLTTKFDAYAVMHAENEHKLLYG